jgi:excisionase family DNA binding protein
MASKLLTTGQAAHVCSVTPDTILKWIRSGRLRARRTAGGHHRVARADLEHILQTGPVSPAGAAPAEVTGERRLRFCWEHKGAGRLLDGCRRCVVYELRAQRCYDVVKRHPDLGHSRLFCKGSCEECDYYRHVRQQATNVLVVTDDADLAAALRGSRPAAPFNLELADCEYTCSAVVETFRPDFAVVDCSLGPERAADIVTHLSEDPRIPFVRVIVSGRADDLPDDCQRMIFARIDRPVRIDDLAGFTATGGDDAGA